ncbi:MAG: hypothetical protein ABIG43_02200 [Chloroflexota bacterium]
MRRRYLTYIAVILAVLFQFGQVTALDAPQTLLEKVEVLLMPEFDQPSMLVIYNVTLAEDTPLPLQVSLQIPAHISSLLRVGFNTADGQFQATTYQLNSEADWTNVTFITGSLSIQVEYYDSNLVKDGDRQSFLFTWMSQHDVSDFVFHLHIPIGASQVMMTPDLGSSQHYLEGFDCYKKSSGSVAAGHPVTLELSYNWSADDLSDTAFVVQPVEPIGEGTAGRTSESNTIMILLMVIAGLILLGIVIYYWWYWNNMRKMAIPEGRRAASVAPTTPLLYCQECGQRSAIGDQYCRNCGADLKRK